MVSSINLPDEICQLLKDGKTLRKKSYRGRFAPSPSGQLHLGNLRTALISWLRARLSNGIWLLRIDDLDTPRCRLGAIDSLCEDLHWLGLNWDGPIILQSQRKKLYSAVLSALKLQGRLYACTCSRKLLTKTNPSDGSKSIYPGTCRDLNLPWDPFDGKTPSWRLKVDRKFSQSCGDVVLRRSDGIFAYHLATVVDELTLGITEVVRGQDLEEALQPQLAVINALDELPILYKHVPLVRNDDGTKLSKREGGIGVKNFQSKGYHPSNVIGLLASSLDLVPEGTNLSANELLCEMIQKKNKSESY